MRTDDTSYGADYWNSLDGGNGYTDSVMWSDLAFLVHHVAGYDHQTGEDICGSVRHLDVGCGPGIFCSHMRKRGFESFGVDVSSYALGVAPESIRSHLYEFDLSFVNDTHFGRNAFPLVTSFETLEHIEAENSGRAIDHILNLLTPGGLAILTICVLGNPGWESDPTHVHVVERSWWDEAFLRHGFARDDDVRDELMRFHLFEKHGGVFALRKPR